MSFRRDEKMHLGLFPCSVVGKDFVSKDESMFLQKAQSWPASGAIPTPF
jgi:hypothetical protein